MQTGRERSLDIGAAPAPDIGAAPAPRIRQAMRSGSKRQGRLGKSRLAERPAGISPNWQNPSLLARRRLEPRSNVHRDAIHRLVHSGNDLLRLRLQGFAEAMDDLARMYVHRQGVPKNYVQAHMWFNLAASRYSGDPFSARSLRGAPNFPRPPLRSPGNFRRQTALDRDCGKTRGMRRPMRCVSRQDHWDAG